MKKKLRARHRKTLLYIGRKALDAVIPFAAVTVLGKVLQAVSPPKLSGLGQYSNWPVGTPENCYERKGEWDPATRTCSLDAGGAVSATGQQQCYAAGGQWIIPASGVAYCTSPTQAQSVQSRISQCYAGGGYWDTTAYGAYGDGQCVGGSGYGYTGTTSPANLMTQLIQWGLNNGYIRTHSRQSTRRCAATSIYASSPYCSTIFVETRTGRLYQGVKAAQRMKLYYQAYGGGQSLQYQYGQGYDYYSGQVPEVSAIPWE